MKVHNIWIDKEISALGGEFFISSSQIVAEIKKAKEAKATTLHIIINSPGGEVFEGYAIYNALRSSGLKIEATNTGLCASIATLIICAAEIIYTYPASQFMFHNPSGGAMGNAKDLESRAEALRQMEDTMAEEYAKKTGKTADEMRALMEKETWLTPEQAKEMGFVTSVIEPVAAYGRFKPNTKNMSFSAKIDNAFKAFKEALKDAVSADQTAFSEQLADESGWIYGDGDLQVGKIAYSDEAMTMPAPAGEHAIKSGKIVVTDETGTILEVREAATDDSASAELKAAQAKIAELEAAKVAAEAKATAAEAEKSAAIAKIETAFTALQSKVVSAGVDLKQDPIDPDKDKDKPHPLDIQAKHIQRTVKR